MNYWPAESANLAELHGPLLDMIGDLAVTGAKTAATNYGARGWVRASQRGSVAADRARRRLRRGRSRLGVWPMGGPWLAQHLWEHYAFGGDHELPARRAPTR